MAGREHKRNHLMHFYHKPFGVQSHWAKSPLSNIDQYSFKGQLPSSGVHYRAIVLLGMRFTTFLRCYCLLSKLIKSVPIA